MQTILTQPDTVVGIVFNAEGQVDIVRRNCPPQVGLWALPGGERWEWEEPKAAIEREVYEETGIVMQGTELVVREGSIHYFKGQELLRDVQFYENDFDAQWEVSDFAWVDADNPIVYQAYPDNKRILDKYIL